VPNWWFRLRGTGSMCHMIFLNVEFGNACRFRVIQCHFSTVPRFPFPRFQSPQCWHARTKPAARIFTKHSKCWDKFFVLTMSLYAFISLLYKQLLQYTLLKSFTVPSALLTKFNIIYRFLKIVHENTLTLWRRHVSFEYRGLLQNTPASFLLVFVKVQASL